jgi:sugar lactone lactonase YvrE
MPTHRRLLTSIIATWLVWCTPCVLAAAGPDVSKNGSGTIKTVKKFNPAKSQLPEGVAVDKEGNVYVGFYPTGQIVKITPAGGESVFAQLDVGTSGGGLVGFEMDEEDNLYVCDATFEEATHGIWKVDQKGVATLFATLNPNGFPNDLVFDANGDLFVTDSYLGEIWKISKSGEAEVWLQDRLMDPLFAYGANGIAFDGADMFVANTDQGAVVRIKFGKDGGSPHAELFAQSPLLVGADGISFDPRHHAYVTVDYQNLLVLISPVGQIEGLKVLAAAGQNLDFPADTTFGHSHGLFLFWTNGGYNFSKPSLQELNVEVEDDF